MKSKVAIDFESTGGDESGQLRHLLLGEAEILLGFGLDHASAGPLPVAPAAGVCCQGSIAKVRPSTAVCHSPRTRTGLLAQPAPALAPPRHRAAAQRQAGSSSAGPSAVVRNDTAPATSEQFAAQGFSRRGSCQQRRCPRRRGRESRPAGECPLRRSSWSAGDRFDRPAQWPPPPRRARTPPCPL